MSTRSRRYALFHWRSCHGLMALGAHPGETDWRYTLGSAALPAALERSILAEGVEVRLRANVSAVTLPPAAG